MADPNEAQAERETRCRPQSKECLLWSWNDLRGTWHELDRLTHSHEHPHNEMKLLRLVNDLYVQHHKSLESEEINVAIRALGMVMTEAVWRAMDRYEGLVDTPHGEEPLNREWL